MEVGDVCMPIVDPSLLISWKCDCKCWIHKHDVVPLSDRSEYCNTGFYLDTRDKADVFSEYKLPSNIIPKTIFCHDYKGGYQEDKFCDGTPNTNTYRFFNWAGIDIFIYFSHQLVTIPTQGWLNAGHIHGVPVLGTLITEWKQGEEIWRNVLSDIEKTNIFSQKLAEVCAHYKFDGYLLNVENVIPKSFVPRLVQFVKLLKSHLDLYCGRRTWLIWYDSVTIEGKLEWQNKLSLLNKPFFDVCDGIFLNYVWTQRDLINSLELAGERRHNVFVGVDIWGRNCYQDGGWNVDKALSVIRSLNMSVAFFGPGWTFETLPPTSDFLTREISFWKHIWPFLFVHGPAALPFETNFCQGITLNKGEPWFNLGMQQYQPTAQNSCFSLYTEDSFQSSGACLKITSPLQNQRSKTFYRAFVCDFSGESESTQLLITVVLKNAVTLSAKKFRIYFILEDKDSIDGKKNVCMKTRPKGYRVSTQVHNLTAVGSVIDFTSEKQTLPTKIKVVNEVTAPISSWHEVKFLLDLNADVSLTEILLLPDASGSILWGHLKIEKFKAPTIIDL